MDPERNTAAEVKHPLRDPKSPTHHLIFAEDANNTLWASTGVIGPGAVGWLNRKMSEETGDCREPS